MSNRYELISRLKEKYPNNCYDLLLKLKKKYGNNKEDFFIKRDKVEKTEIIFTEDAIHNKNVVDEFKQDTGEIYNLIEENIVSKSKENILKCVLKFQKDLNKVLKKISNPDEISKTLCNTLKSSLLKIWEYSGVSEILIKYLIKWGFKKVEFNSGHKLTDEDLEYLDENYFQIRAKETKDISQKNKVIEMIRPAFVINYILDDEHEYMIIPGDCSYYKY